MSSFVSLSASRPLAQGSGWRFYAGRHDHEVVRLVERLHGRKQRRWRHDEFALLQIQPPAGAADPRAEFSIPPENLMPEQEAAAIRRVARQRISHLDLFLQSDFLEVLD